MTHKTNWDSAVCRKRSHASMFSACDFTIKGNCPDPGQVVHICHDIASVSHGRNIKSTYVVVVAARLLVAKVDKVEGSSAVIATAEISSGSKSTGIPVYAKHKVVIHQVMGKCAKHREAT